jgi:putative tricarboxylic transport membrane protein
MQAGPAWPAARAKHGWEDAYLAGDAFSAFLKQENARIAQVLTEAGLVK